MNPLESQQKPSEASAAQPTPTDGAGAALREARPSGTGALDIFDSLPGRTLGHYQVLEAIGAGTTGTVYRGRDLRTGRVVALKVLPAALAADADSIRRFHREATCLSALDHPNLVTLFSLEDVQGAVFLVMEHVTGSTLAAALPPAGFPPAQALAYARQIAAGLVAAHAKGIIHRDLKLSNLLIAEDGAIKIADFGLAKVATPGADITDRTREGMILGTADYMSPEQVRGEQADARSDLFSFGVVLWELLTGKSPFRRGNSPETWAAILKEEPPNGNRIPKAIRPLLARCLSKDPASRFQSAQEVLQALGSATGQLAPRWLRRHQAAAVSVTVGLAFAAWFGYRLSAADERLTPAAQFDRAIDAQKKAIATGCFKDSSAPCPIQTATTDLQQSVADFEAILKVRPNHASSLWNEALAEQGLCELHSRMKQWPEARRACDQGTSHLSQALAPGVSYNDLPSRRPDEADVLWNRAITRRMRAQLPDLDANGKKALLAQAIADIDRVLHGGKPYAAFLQKRAGELADYRSEIQKELSAAQ